MPWETPLIENDAVVLGLLFAILALVFRTAASERPAWRRFYSVVPSLLLCYFLPSLLATFGIVDPERSKLYSVAKNYLLPTSLLLLTLSADIPGVLRLGPKAIVMFLTGTVGIVIGGPLAFLAVRAIHPEAVEGEVWRGLTTVAGSWIGGGANQTAMKEVFTVDDSVFSAMIAVDVLVANVWMPCLLLAAGRARSIDRWLRADTSAIDELQQRMEEYEATVVRVPRLSDGISVLAVGFLGTAIAHAVADVVAPSIARSAPALGPFSLTSEFFWIVVVATTLGVVLSFTRVRRLEGVGASRTGSICLYVLVATIGMKMDLSAVHTHRWLFLVGLIWIAIHAGLLIGVARIIRAPVFFLAVGSQANIGGAASAPIVASAFHPALAPVGVLLAVVGYALGTAGAWLCGQLLRLAAGDGGGG